MYRQAPRQTNIWPEPELCFGEPVARSAKLLTNAAQIISLRRGTDESLKITLVDTLVVSNQKPNIKR